MSIFEYGAGNSTLYFSKRVNHVVSIEHDFDWYKKVKAQINSKNVRIHHYELGDDYIQAIKSVDKNLDIILIDGRQRVKCTLAASHKLNSSGVLILDDSNRKHYNEAKEYVTRLGYKKLDFWGLNLGSIEFKSSSLFYKDNNCLGV